MNTKKMYPNEKFRRLVKLVNEGREDKTKKQFEKEDNKELTRKFLLQIRENRFTDVDSIKNEAESDKEGEYFLKVFDKLKQLGYIKERVEITKRGIKYLAKK